MCIYRFSIAWRPLTCTNNIPSELLEKKLTNIGHIYHVSIGRSLSIQVRQNMILVMNNILVYNVGECPLVT